MKPKDLFEKLLATLVVETQQYFSDNLVGILLFGSTVRQLKAATDIDLMVLCKTLPNDRYQRWDLFSCVEARLKPELKKLANQGYHLEFSPILRTPEELAYFKSIYLDFPETSRILFDPENHFTNLIKRVDTWIKSSGAKKVQCGNLWYWDLKPNSHLGESYEVGWTPPKAG